ncbi:unnamed protein product [Brassica oleracea]
MWNAIVIFFQKCLMSNKKKKKREKKRRIYALFNIVIFDYLINSSYLIISYFILLI